MVTKLPILLLAFLFLLPSAAHAQLEETFCLYSQACTTDQGQAGVQSCKGTTTQDENNQSICVFNSTVDPACGNCQVLDQSPPTTTIPGPATTTTNPPSNTTPSSSSPPSKEEQAAGFLEDGLLPKDIESSEQQSNANIFQQLADKLKGFLDQVFILGGQQIKDEKKLFSQSEGLQQGSVPKDLKPKESETPANQEKQFLGTKTGFYGDDLPIFSDQTDRDIKTDEKSYVKANFPTGVDPVTP